MAWTRTVTERYIEVDSTTITEDRWRSLHALAGEPNPGRFKSWASHFMFTPLTDEQHDALTAALRAAELPFEVTTTERFDPSV